MFAFCVKVWKLDKYGHHVTGTDEVEKEIEFQDIALVNFSLKLVVTVRAVSIKTKRMELLRACEVGLEGLKIHRGFVVFNGGVQLAGLCFTFVVLLGMHDGVETDFLIGVGRCVAIIVGALTMTAIHTLPVRPQSAAVFMRAQVRTDLRETAEYTAEAACTNCSPPRGSITSSSRQQCVPLI